MEIMQEMAKTDDLKHTISVYLKLHFLQIPMDSVQYNTEHYEMHHDMDNEHSRNHPLESESFVLIQRRVRVEWMCANWLLFVW